MARGMSFVMALFMVVPVVAPTLGAVLVVAGSWRWVFGGCAVAGAIMAV